MRTAHFVLTLDSGSYVCRVDTHFSMRDGSTFTDVAGITDRPGAWLSLDDVAERETAALGEPIGADRVEAAILRRAGELATVGA